MQRVETSLGPEHVGAFGWRHVSTVPSDDDALVDYTIVPAGWRIVGHLDSGHLTKWTVRCRECGRVGVLASGKGERLVVHRGRASYDTLHAVDYCELLITSH